MVGRFQASFFAVLFSLCSAGALAEEVKEFRQPRFHDDRLDWCQRTGGASNPGICGQPVADEFCRMRRYTRTVDFRAENAGGATRFLHSNERCTGSGCLGFGYIKCSGSVPHTRVFAPPSVGGKRLDFCREWGANCGAPAANAFCASKDLGVALYYRSDPDVQPTQVISSGQVCDAPTCTSFNIITCNERFRAAVAIHTSGRWGAALNVAPSKAVAADALKRCGGGCSIAALGPGRCVAVAFSRASGIWFGYAHGDDRTRVEAIAMKGCTDRAPQGTCRMEHVNCI
jgi:Domain of unknown function (DUF4189)